METTYGALSVSLGVNRRNPNLTVGALFGLRSPLASNCSTAAADSYRMAKKSVQRSSRSFGSTGSGGARSNSG